MAEIAEGRYACVGSGTLNPRVVAPREQLCLKKAEVGYYSVESTTFSPLIKFIYMNYQALCEHQKKQKQHLSHYEIPLLFCS